MTDLYQRLLEADTASVDGQGWNAGYHNLKVCEIADMVRERVGDQVEIVVTPTDDIAPYQALCQDACWRISAFRPALGEATRSWT